MKRLRIRRSSHPYYQDDIDRMIKICSDKGYAVDDLTVEEAWHRHSDCYAAGWLMMDPDDEYIFTCLMRELEEVPE